MGREMKIKIEKNEKGIEISYFWSYSLKKWLRYTMNLALKKIQNGKGTLIQ